MTAGAYGSIALLGIAMVLFGVAWLRERSCQREDEVRFRARMEANRRWFESRGGR